jgi:hypothetical protein
MKRFQPAPFENICTSCCKRKPAPELIALPFVKTYVHAYGLPVGWYTILVGAHRGTVCSEECAEAFAEFHLATDTRASP